MHRKNFFSEIMGNPSGWYQHVNTHIIQKCQNWHRVHNIVEAAQVICLSCAPFFFSFVNKSPISLNSSIWGSTPLSAQRRKSTFYDDHDLICGFSSQQLQTAQVAGNHGTITPTGLQIAEMESWGHQSVLILLPWLHQEMLIIKAMIEACPRGGRALSLSGPCSMPSLSRQLSWAAGTKLLVLKVADILILDGRHPRWGRLKLN